MAFHGHLTNTIGLQERTDSAEHVFLEVPGMLLVLVHHTGLGAAHALAVAGSAWNEKVRIQLPVIAKLRALKTKKDDFWQTLINAAEPMQIPAQFRLCARAREIIRTLPETNQAIREALTESVDRLQRANEALLAQSLTSIQFAEGKIAHPGLCSTDLPLMVQQLMGDGGYPELLIRDVASRQEEVLPVVKTTTDSASNILEDCRVSSRCGFDVLKFDIYNRGAPKTPTIAKEIAQELIDAAGQTRRQFASFVTDMALGIAGDAQGAHRPDGSPENSTALQPPRDRQDPDESGDSASENSDEWQQDV